jgi:hypothetical protein
VSTTPTFWGPDAIGVSNYIGAGGDSVQPPLQPRPELHAVYWPARMAELRLAAISAPNDATSVVDLTPFAGDGELDGDGGEFFRRFDRARLLVHASGVVIVLPTDEKTDVFVYEISGAELELAATGTMPFGIEGTNLSVMERRSPTMGWPRVTLVGDQLVFQSREDGSATFELAEIEGGDVRHRQSVHRGRAVEVGPLRTLGTIVVSERVVEDSGGFSYLLDRLDLTDPGRPVHLRSVNVPGAVIASSEDGRQLVSVGYERARMTGVTTCCPGGGGCGSMVDTCDVTHERISVVDVGDDDGAYELTTLVPEAPLGLTAVAPAGLTAFGSSGSLAEWPAPETAELVSVAIDRNGDLSVFRQPIAAAPSGYQTPFIARNETHVALVADYGMSLAVLAATPDGVFGTPELLQTYVSDLAMTAETLLVATGTNGVLAVPLTGR